MVAKDRMGIMIALKQYKTDVGAVNYPKVLSIPISERLPELAKNNFVTIVKIVAAALTVAFEGMNLKRGMTEVQIADLAEAILDSSTEDYLSMEDLMLFLQKFIRGEYGAMYESMDIPKFMLAFEVYRQERHESLMEIRNNKHLESKGLGSSERTSKKDEIDEHFFNMANQISNMRDQLKETRKENQKLKDIDKF